jgi:hypothetical protein
MLVIATLAAAAALTFGALATRATPGQANLFTTTGTDQGAVSGALSFRARAITPRSSHPRALQTAFARAHGSTRATTPLPHHVLEATHQRVLWALATFALADGTTVVERFSWRRGEGWRDLGATRARCPAVPPEVRGAWRLTACG